MKIDLEKYRRYRPVSDSPLALLALALLCLLMTATRMFSTFRRLHADPFASLDAVAGILPLVIIAIAVVQLYRKAVAASGKTKEERRSRLQPKRGSTPTRPPVVEGTAVSATD